ncbi:hypothetical protein [Microbacterium sp.]|uniref:hypothetical protein n=1 Tax=Microbacterium sp. TaxID=51671 RepID=UPI0039E548EE
MSTRREARVTAARAIRSHAEDVVRAALVALPPRERTRRGLAFHAYQRQVRTIMRADPVAFEVVETRMLAEGHRTSVIEVTLRGEVGVDAGDMLHVLWRNDLDRIAAADAVTAARFWTTPIPHRPSRWARVGASGLLESVVDLSASTDSDPARAERITPRFFTVAGVEASDVRLQVTHTAGMPPRAASFLARVRPGDVVEARVLPHPHRVAHDGPGLAVVTGSGAAGVFAALRAGASGIRLVWGLGDKQLAPWVQEELREHLRAGRLSSLRLALRPERVTDLLVDEPIEQMAWIYVSGHESMGAAVDAALRARLGESVLREMSDGLRCIVST